MANTNYNIQLSKTLSYLLRHQPAKFGLTLDIQGWCEVDALLSAFAARNIDLSREMLEYIVENNDKKRFAFNSDGTKIRASQGHSLEVELDYQPVPPPAILFHGTTEQFLDAILKQGLQKRKRHHVHLSPDVETAVNVGKRRGKPVILSVRAGQMYVDGHLFYCSANGVWLTGEVPPQYLAVEHNS